MALAALLVGCGADVPETADAQSDAVAGADARVTNDAATDAPADADAGAVIPSPIRYVLVLLKENHTFDDDFTGFPGATSSATAKEGTQTVTRPIAPNGPLPGDICHTNACGVAAYDHGAMNGFATAGLVRYTESQIPNYWQYARNFVLADHYFATTLAPSSPGHSVLWNAQSPMIDNPVCPQGGACNGFGCVGWKDATVKGIVLHTPTEQASVPRLVEELWGMEFMTKRDPRTRRHRT